MRIQDMDFNINVIITPCQLIEKQIKKKATVFILISAEVDFRINTRETSKSGSIHQEEISVPICMCWIAKPQIT